MTQADDFVQNTADVSPLHVPFLVGIGASAGGLEALQQFFH